MIDNFPDSINRDHFGWYISGLTDGEGCFCLLLNDKVRHGKRKQERPTPSASFAINLRRDDDGILKLIQSYFRCGNLVYGKTRNMCSLRFRKLEDLVAVIYHFDKFPLFAKKAVDFNTWRQAVGLMLFISKRVQKRSQRYGSSYKWDSASHAWFTSLRDELMQERKFKVVPDEEGGLRNTAQS